MNAIFKKYPVVSRFLLAIILFGFSLFVTEFIQIDLIKKYFPFVSVILLTISTWFLYKTENKTLKAIGLNLSFRNIGFLFLGLAIGAAALGLQKYITSFYTGEKWTVNPSVIIEKLALSLYIILPTVAVEEFLFRGYLFKKTIEISSVVKANIIFSVLFMLVHILDANVLQNPVQLIFLAVSIPVGHLLFATALLKSKTLLFPIGLHWGNNWTAQHILGYNANDSSLLLTTSNNNSSWTPFIIILFLFNGFFLLLTFLIWKWGSWKS